MSPVPVVGVLLALSIGIVLGGISGYYGGRIDFVFQRVIELVLSLPTIPIWINLVEGKDLGMSGGWISPNVINLQALVEGMACSPGGAALAAGDVVTTGTWTDAWPLQPGQVWRTRLSDARLAGLRLTVVV